MKSFITILLTALISVTGYRYFKEESYNKEKNTVQYINKVLDSKDYLVEPALIKAMIYVESNGNERAYNQHTGAVGLMQLTPVIYSGLCGLTKEEAFEPNRNVACGTLFMAHLLDKYHGNKEKALLHYNNGHVITNPSYPKKVFGGVDKRN